MQAAWYLVTGCVLLFMALMNTYLRNLPLTNAFIYILIGVCIGPWGADLLRFDPVGNSGLLESISEVVVIISLFTAGLKLRVPLNDIGWWLPVKLATLGMVLAVALVTGAAMWLFDLPFAEALLLGAILSPTDPVLASDVQVRNPKDQDRIRFTLTGEAGLNDGTAFPFVMLGLGCLRLHDLGEYGVRWFAIDVVWASMAGLGVGFVLGIATARLAIYMRTRKSETVIFDDFLALGLIALSYGVALSLNAYGFLSVFAAALAFRSTERRLTGDAPLENIENLARWGNARIDGNPTTAATYTAQAVLLFNEQIERILEVGVVILVGSLLWLIDFSWQQVLFVLLLFFVIRPASVWVLAFTIPKRYLDQGRLRPLQISLIGWFGIRGIGSIYYLMYAIERGADQATATVLTSITLTVVTASVFFHGVSVTPLMAVYSRLLERARSRSLRSAQKNRVAESPAPLS